MTQMSRVRVAALAFVTIMSAVSCITVDKTLGSGLLPDDYKMELKKENFNLPVKTKMSDSLQTIYSGYLLFGSHKDPELGLTTVSTAFQFVPTVTDNDYGDNPEANFFRIYIPVGKRIVLDEKDSGIPQNIYIYRITKDLDSTTAYSNSITLADIDPVPLNKPTVYFGGDSIVCDLSLEYADEILNSTKEERDSVNIFLKRFKGLCITTEPLPGALEGGRFNAVTTSDVFMLMSYKHISAENNINQPDSVISFYADINRINLNSFSHSSQNLTSNLPSQKIYLEGGAGIKPYIDFSSVKSDLLDWATLNNYNPLKVIVTKAEVVFPFEFPSNYLTLGQYPITIFLASRVKSDSSSYVYYNPLSDIYINGSGGQIDRFNSEYRLNVTTYIQHLLNNKYESEDVLKTWLVPILAQTNSSTGNTSYFVENIVYYKAVLNGNLAARAPKLEVYYTIIK